jgi:hypothetical protein
MREPEVLMQSPPVRASQKRRLYKSLPTLRPLAKPYSSHAHCAWRAEGEVLLQFNML